MTLIMVGLWAAPSIAQEEPLVNLDHLRYLTEPVTINGQDMAIVHIYAEFPSYAWVDDADEGLSCVDDVARAAVVYLWEYERTGDAALLELARRSLNFVLYMQAEDGEFYNFVWDREGTQNLTGGTSYKSLTWWAMRGLWALGEGVRVFDTADATYADTLAAAYLKTERALAATLSNYGQYTSIHGYEVPAWIPGGEPNVASIGLLGLAAYYTARPNDATADVITRIADGVAQYRLGDHLEYPWGMHPVRANAPGFWTNWGAHAPHALVMAGLALDRPDWIESARMSAESFLMRHLTLEPFRHIGVVPSRMEQIAYGTNMLVLAYAALYQATGDEAFARYAGLAASWYFGNNMAGVAMYDPATGRVYDGINGPVSWRVNRNSGAESTIEGLMSLAMLARIPQALPYLSAQPEPFNSYRVLEAEAAERVIGTPIYYTGDWTGEGYISGGRYIGLGEGQRMRLMFEVSQTDDYLLYAAHVRQARSAATFTIPYLAAPPAIDGSADDWPADVPRLESNTARQFLRGAGIWQGPEIDSHSISLGWDEDALYLLADVRDPQHQQDFTVSNVWQGDTLWLYFTTQANARTLDAKFTLAQTPSGPQIWDWQRARFAPDSELAWQPTDNGYRYEARIAWHALELAEPAAGVRIGFEAGRGVGGSSFMNLTGRDPDVAANLLALTLTTPDSDLSLVSAPEVALEVRVNSQDSVIIPQSVSPDSDYFWLDLVTPTPLRLEAGEHRLRFEYAGESSSANPGISKVDAFVLVPAVQQRSFTLADGRRITLAYNTLTGDVNWSE
jgi:hypothetical protein